MSKSLRSRYRKSRDLIDYDYTAKLGPLELDYLEAFTASFYNGSPTLHAGSVPAEEANALNGARRRDLMAVGARVEGSLEDISELPAYRSAFAGGRKKYRRAVARKRRSA